jgi:hypothetical protein
MPMKNPVDVLTAALSAIDVTEADPICQILLNRNQKEDTWECMVQRVSMKDFEPGFIRIVVSEDGVEIVESR